MEEMDEVPQPRNLLQTTPSDTVVNTRTLQNETISRNRIERLAVNTPLTATITARQQKWNAGVFGL
jgi:hypothetical protein